MGDGTTGKKGSSSPCAASVCILRVGLQLRQDFLGTSWGLPGDFLEVLTAFASFVKPKYDKAGERLIHLLCVGWRNLFSSCAVVSCQFLVLAGDNHLSCQNTITPIMTGKNYDRKKRCDTCLTCQNTNTTNHTLI